MMIEVSEYSADVIVEKIGDRLRGWVVDTGDELRSLDVESRGRELLGLVERFAPEGLSLWHTPTLVVDGVAVSMDLVLVGDVSPDHRVRLS